MNILVCPACGGELSLTVLREVRVSRTMKPAAKPCARVCAYADSAKTAGRGVPPCETCRTLEIEEGILSCAADHAYPVISSIPRMLPDAFAGRDAFLARYHDHLPAGVLNRGEIDAFRREHGDTQVSFGYEWLRYDVAMAGEDRETFFADSQLSEELLRDKMILDAGCGMGRYTAIAGELGGEIVGIDLSESVLRAHEVTRSNPAAHIVQANILSLPFGERQFDVIYSLGVIHHTPDARESFMQLSRHLRGGGIFSVWVYGRAGRFSTFATNPLRSDRKRYIRGRIAQRLHWMAVLSRELSSAAARLLTTRLPVPLLYRFCYLLAAAGAIPLFKYLTASVHHNWRVRLLENFDWFSPPYQSHHTKDEVLAWCREANLQDVSLLRHGFIPKVGIKGILNRN